MVTALTVAKNLNTSMITTIDHHLTNFNRLRSKFQASGNDGNGDSTNGDHQGRAGATDDQPV